MPAANANITCSICGQPLSLFERIVAYRKNDTYVCHGCCENICRKDGYTPFANFRTGRFAAKLIFGVLFVFSMPGQESLGSALVALVLGGALIAWALVPVMLEKSRVDSIVALAVIDKTVQDNTRHKCSNCGAVGTGRFCEYCGAPFER